MGVSCSVDVPFSKLKVEIARLLIENHYIHDYKVLEEANAHSVLRGHKCPNRSMSDLSTFRRSGRSGAVEKIE